MNSLFLALVGATACMLLASLASYITVRTKIAGRGLHGRFGFHTLGLSRNGDGSGAAVGVCRFSDSCLRHHLDHL